jgi:large subunit ribosomal protein L30e
LDINRALKTAVLTGKVYLGRDQTVKALKRNEVKLVIIASNCTEAAKALLKKQNAPRYRFPGNNLELGSACGKPFSVSMVSILDPGESNILDLEKDSNE